MHVGGLLAPESYGPNEHIPPADLADLKFARTPITHPLADVGLGPDKIEVVINCHLHAIKVADA